MILAFLTLSLLDPLHVPFLSLYRYYFVLPGFSPGLNLYKNLYVARDLIRLSTLAHWGSWIGSSCRVGEIVLLLAFCLYTPQVIFHPALGPVQSITFVETACQDTFLSVNLLACHKLPVLWNEHSVLTTVSKV